VTSNDVTKSGINPIKSTEVRDMITAVDAAHLPHLHKGGGQGKKKSSEYGGA